MILFTGKNDDLISDGRLLIQRFKPCLVFIKLVSRHVTLIYSNQSHIYIQISKYHTTMIGLDLDLFGFDLLVSQQTLCWC